VPKSPWSIPLKDTELKTSVGDQGVTSDPQLDRGPQRKSGSLRVERNPRNEVEMCNPHQG
jgi:hypothetical protein